MTNVSIQKFIIFSEESSIVMFNALEASMSNFDCAERNSNNSFLKNMSPTKDYPEKGK